MFGLIFMVSTVRTWTRHFVPLFGSLLFLGSGSPLFAGIISQPEFGAANRSGFFQADLVPRDLFGPLDENPSAAMTLAHEEGSPSGRGKINTPQEKSFSLLGAPGPKEQRFGPSLDYNGLIGEDDSGPTAPRPTAPPTRGETGAAGVAPNLGPKDQQNGVLAGSAPQTPEGETASNFRYVRTIFDPQAPRLFRPPRGR